MPASASRPGRRSQQGRRRVRPRARRVHLRGTYLMSREVARAMLEPRRGSDRQSRRRSPHWRAFRRAMPTARRRPASCLDDALDGVRMGAQRRARQRRRAGLRAHRAGRRARAQRRARHARDRRAHADGAHGSRPRSPKRSPSSRRRNPASSPASRCPSTAAGSRSARPRRHCARPRVRRSLSRKATRC